MRILIAVCAAFVFALALLGSVSVFGSYALTVTGRTEGPALPHLLTLGVLFAVLLLSGRVGSRALEPR